MSVAFRRESDEEHLEPRFELPIPAGPNLVTRAGLTLIDTRIAALTAARDDRDTVIAAETAAGVAPAPVRTDGSGGDPARAAIVRELRYWQTRHATARLTAPPTDGSVGFGSVVDIVVDGKPRRIAIVGDDEADPKADRIAFSAPLARVLIGAEVGDRLPFAGREEAVAIIGIR